MFAIERPRQPVQRAILAALGRTGHGDDTVVLGDLHALRDLLLQRAERAADRNAARLQLDGDAGRDFDWSFSDSTHVDSPDEADDLAADAALLRGSAVTRPDDVDRIATPIPPSTRGRRSFRA